MIQTIIIPWDSAIPPNKIVGLARIRAGDSVENFTVIIDERGVPAFQIDINRVDD